MTTCLRLICQLLSLLLLLPGCTENTFSTRTIHIQLVLEDSTLVLPLGDIPVTLKNQTLSNAYTVTTDTEGRADLTTAPGSCTISFSHTLTKGLTTYNYNGGYADLNIEPGDKDIDLEIPITLNAVPQLVIDELYFGGCLKPDGKSTYTTDQYLTIANNSSRTLYLDGLCIGQAAPFTTTKPSGWMKYTDMKEIPLTMMCWQFPGNGTDYPLLPGQRQIVATNAIDHTAGEAGIPASLDLSHVEWAFWNATLSGSKITAGVKPLRLIWHTSGTAYALTVSGPTVLLFMPQSDMAAWVADAAHIRKEPESSSILQYLHIPAEWVIDVANYVSSPSLVVNSRLPFNIDPEPGIAGPSGQGNAWRRAHWEKDGQIVWKAGSGTYYNFNEEAPSLKDISDTNQ